MIARVAGIAALAALLAGAFVYRAAGKMPDFEVYWRAGTRAAAAEPLYRAEDGHYQVKYLPAFAVAAIPVSRVPLPAAKAIWFALSAAGVAVLLALSLRLLPDRHRPGWILVLLTAIAMAKFYGHELVLGQVNVLLAILLVAAVLAARAGRSASAGLLIAAAVIVKPYAVIFVPWLAARRDVRALAACCAGISGALALPVILYGVQGTIALHQAWWTTVSESTAPNLLNPDNVSLAAMFAKWFGPGGPAAVAAAAGGLVLLGVAGLVLSLRGRVTAPDALDASLLLTLIPLLSPQGWDYVFLAATPAVMLLLNYDRRLPVALRAAVLVSLGVIAFSLYDVLGRQAYRAFMDLSIITVCFLVVVAGLAGLRIVRAA